MLDKDLLAESDQDAQVIYAESKFAQLLGAHWWRRQLQGSCEVVAVSPGLIPQTRITRHSDMKLSMSMPDAKTVPEGEFGRYGTNREDYLLISLRSQGAESVLRAFTRDDFPEDADQIFLTSWGKWWSRGVLEKSLDKKLQDKWSPSKEEIEKEMGDGA